MRWVLAVSVIVVELSLVLWFLRLSRKVEKARADVPKWRTALWLCPEGCVAVWNERVL